MSKHNLNKILEQSALLNSQIENQGLLPLQRNVEQIDQTTKKLVSKVSVPDVAKNKA